MTRAAVYHWPPGSWDDWTLARYVRFLQAEQTVIEQREQEARERETTVNAGRDDG